jgi:hypothetical protein
LVKPWSDAPRRESLGVRKWVISGNERGNLDFMVLAGCATPRFILM